MEKTRFAVTIRRVHTSLFDRYSIMSKKKILKSLKTAFKVLEDHENSKGAVGVWIHPKHSTFGMLYSMKGLLRTKANTVIFIGETKIAGIYNYSPIGKWLALLPALERIYLLVYSYFPSIQILSNMVFESRVKTTRALLITDKTGFSEKPVSFPVYRYIVNKGIKSYRFELRKKLLPFPQVYIEAI